jgi:hypothetical protein
MTKKRILYLLDHYPQISETYIENELRQLIGRYEIRVLALKDPDMRYDNHLSFTRVKSKEHLVEVARAFRPDVVHGHYTVIANALAFVARLLDRPFTLRSHSFDVVGPIEEKLDKFVPFLTDQRCLGILAFPFARPILARAGVKEERIHDCWPVVDFARFHDESPNGKAIMNVGACIPKKNMEDYVRFGALLPGRTSNLYPLGYQTQKIQALNRELGEPIAILDPRQPEDMPGEYKKHEWLVYTASPAMRSVGWPMAVAEAQASGVGVCMQNIRPDLAEYVGPAGYLFDRIEEVAEIVAQPFPEERRRQGFAQARKSDVASHIELLERLWQAA